MSASGHPLWFNPPDCLLSDGTIVQMMVKDFLYLEFTEYVGPMCDLEVFASLGHPRICFDCIHSTSITEILLPPLPPPCLLEVWYRLFQTVFNVILVALCRLCYVVFVMCNVQCRTQFFHVDIFLFPVSMSHVYFRF